MQFYTTTPDAETAGQLLHTQLLREARAGISAASSSGGSLVAFGRAVSDSMDDVIFSFLADAAGLR